ncbi:MAG TPA: ABC transporter permease [Feifaniaceae bacterium]|nr:ABC transporter permease [Feifaniaceae bacterium]
MANIKVLNKNNLNNEQLQKIVVAFVLLGMCTLFSIASPWFLTVDNIMTIAMQASITTICAFGMTFDIIAGAIDLSLGSTVALSGCIVTLVLKAGYPLWLALLAGLALGCLVGFTNGIIVARGKIPPFITTLAAQMYLRGLAMVITDAKSIFVNNTPAFKAIAQTYLFDFMPMPIIYMIAVALVASFILRKLVIGRHIYAVGSNEESARLSGVNIVKVRVFAYMVSATMASIAGIIFASRVNSGQPTIGVGYEGSAVAAAVIGGASMSGGHGSISGTVLGAFVMGVLMNGLNLLNVSQNWQQVATGVVLVFAVYLDRVRNMKNRK